MSVLVGLSPVVGVYLNWGFVGVVVGHRFFLLSVSLVVLDGFHHHVVHEPLLALDDFFLLIVWDGCAMLSLLVFFKFK